MLIEYPHLIQKHNLKVTGILHIGACELEEKQWYNQCGIDDEHIQWFEANPKIVADMKKKNPTAKIINYAMGSENKDEVVLNVANNKQSSSLLQLGTHLVEHPQIHYTEQITVSMKRFDSLVESGRVKIEGYNFLNLDVQGYELEVLKGFGDLLHKVDYIYSEVNCAELYIGCPMIEELDKYLNAYGFIRKDTVMLSHKWGDCLYVR